MPYSFPLPSGDDPNSWAQSFGRAQNLRSNQMTNENTLAKMIRDQNFRNALAGGDASGAFAADPLAYQGWQKGQADIASTMAATGAANDLRSQQAELAKANAAKSAQDIEAAQFKAAQERAQVARDQAARALWANRANTPQALTALQQFYPQELQKLEIEQQGIESHALKANQEKDQYALKLLLAATNGQEWDSVINHLETDMGLKGAEKYRGKFDQRDALMQSVFGEQSKLLEEKAKTQGQIEVEQAKARAEAENRGAVSDVGKVQQDLAAGIITADQAESEVKRIETDQKLKTEALLAQIAANRASAAAATPEGKAAAVKAETEAKMGAEKTAKLSQDADIAIDAFDDLAVADELVSKAFTGTWSPLKYYASKASGMNKAEVEATERLQRLFIDQMLPKLQQLSGAKSDKDVQIIMSSIGTMRDEPGSIKTSMEDIKRRLNRIIVKARRGTLGQGADKIDTGMPDAAANKGRVITDTATGKKFVSDGAAWKPVEGKN